VLVLNKLTYLAKIFFTDNIFLIKSDEIETFKILKVKFDFKYFLENIEVKPPQDYLSHHNITNEWAIDRWASVLKIENELIQKNREKIDYLLYYKFLKAKFEQNTSKLGFIKNSMQGKVLLIDDKLEWKEIIKGYLNKFFSKVEFDFLGDFEKDIGIEEIKKRVNLKIEEFNPDTIILDLRLLNSESDKIKEISGYKILEFIKKLNPAIQIILFTASKDSLILNAFFNKVLGYIQKDSPFEKYEYENNFKNFNRLIKNGLKKRYLKDIYEITEKTEKLSFEDKEFEKEIKSNAQLIFNILNSNMENSFVYAVYAMVKILEIVSYKRFANDERALGLKVKEIAKDLNINNEIEQVIKFRNSSIHGGEKRSYYKNFIEKPTSDNIVKWYETCFFILESI